MSATPPELHHHRELVGDLEMHWVEAGDGPTVILLHGFPEFWYSWRRQLADLAGAGFTAVAPDQRGYNLTGKPAGLESYGIGALGGDVLALMDRLEVERAGIAGHDWGGVVAWWLAARHPERIERLAVLNAPHPAAYRRLLSRSDQLLRSWYVLFFQLPRLPEAAIRAFDFGVLDRIFRTQPVREGAFDGDEIAAYKAAVARPGALTAALNWYRANFPGRRRVAARPAGVAPEGGRDRSRSGRVDRHRVEVPTLVIWGERDPYLSPRLAEGLERWVPDVEVVRLPEASHWVLADAPERVSRLLEEFFA